MPTKPKLDKENYRYASHLEALQPDLLAFFVKRAVKTIKRSKIQFDAVAFSGVSGLLVAPAVCAALSKPIIYVRKEKDNSSQNHSSQRVEGYISAKTYLFFDDLISSGRTFITLRETLQKGPQEDYHNIKCAGGYTYLKDVFFTYKSRSKSESGDWDELGWGWSAVREALSDDASASWRFCSASASA